MYELLAVVIGVAVFGGLLVFPTVLLLAKLSHFEPLEFDLLGKTYVIGPKPRRAITFSDAAVVTLTGRQTAFASVVTATLTIAHANTGPVQSVGLVTTSNATSIVRVAP